MPSDGVVTQDERRGSDTTVRVRPNSYRRNATWNIAGLVWTSAVALITLPITVRYLGTDGYGVLTMLTVVTNYVWFLDLGLGQATVKYIADSVAREEWQNTRYVFWASISAYLILGILAATVMLLIAPLCVERWFNVPIALRPAALLSFRIGSLGLLFGLLSYGPASVMRGMERFDLLNKVNMLAGTAQPLLTIALLMMGRSLPVVIVGNVAVGAVALIAQFFIVTRLLLDVGTPVWDGSTARKLLRFGGFLSGSSIVVPVLLNFEKFLLANQVSIAAVAFYMIPHGLAGRLAIIPGSIGNALFPTFSNLHGRGEASRAAELNFRSNRTILRIVLPLVVVPLIFARQLLHLWMGPAFADQSTTALQLLLLASLVNALSWTPHMLVQALGHPNLTFRTYVWELIICTPITFLLVRTWGVDGAAGAWLVRAALDTILIWFVASRVSGQAFPLWKLAVDSRIAIMGAGAVVLWVANSLGGDWINPSRIIGVLLGLGLLGWSSLDDIRQLLRIRAMKAAESTL